MDTYIIREAKPRLGEIVSKAAAGRVTYLLNGKDMVALVPARPTHEVPVGLDPETVHKRLAASEQTPSTPWKKGDAVRIARQALKSKKG